jgi:hypothetical protein
MSVHRQVLSELDQAQRHIHALTQDNQRLQQHNVALLAEIERVVKSVRRLQGLAEHLSPLEVAEEISEGVFPTVATGRSQYEDLREFLPAPSRQDPTLQSPTAQYRDLQEPVIYPEEGTRLQRDGEGWWLILTVLLIVVTAFGTGFLIVRPFLVQSNPVQSNPVQSNPVQSNPVQSNPVQSNPVQSNPVQSNPR